MTNTVCVATITAYAIKAELGGGFRGKYVGKRFDGSIDKVKSDVLPTMSAARHFAKEVGYKRHPSASVAVIGRSSPNYYCANLWVRG